MEPGIMFKSSYADPRTCSHYIVPRRLPGVSDAYPCSPSLLHLNVGQEYSIWDEMIGLQEKPKENRQMFEKIVDITPKSLFKEPLRAMKNGMMDKDVEQAMAINLSTSQDAKEKCRENGHVIIKNGENGESQGLNLQPTPVSKASPPITGAAKRKCKNMMDTVHQPLMMMAAQHGLTPQQMQQLLEQQVLPSHQLQQMMQQQTILAQHQQQQKLQEQLVQQLSEQLQMNVHQQSQILQLQQTAMDKTKKKQLQVQLQQLSMQHQQLIQQIQLQQRQYLLSQGLGMVQPAAFGVPQGMSPAELQQLWKEVAIQSGLDENCIKNLNGISSTANSTNVINPSALIQTQSYVGNGLPAEGYILAGGLMMNNHSALQSKVEEQNVNNTSNPLYRHSVCKWPGCDSPCEDFAAFIKHLNLEHTLDDRSTAQARVQMQVVSQLEIQLSREKELLQSMMQHLHMNQNGERKPEASSPVLPKPPAQPIASSSPSTTPLVTSPIIISSSSSHSIPQPLVPSPPTLHATPTQPSLSQNSCASVGGPIRRRISDECNLPISEGKNLDYLTIQRNRDFYKNTDVRPPFTYASLIRQGIIESPHRQLTLNEIYQWFQNTFAYFRRNEATWKNAVRHNLSLHKCFMRVENVKGAVWTVDEVEFYKRRPQKIGGYEDDFGSFWMVDDYEFIRRRHLTRGRPRKYHETDNSAQNLKVKSASYSSDSSLQGETINASLRAALAESNLSLFNHNISSNHTVDGVEDLSMKSHMTDATYDQMNEEEMLMMGIKREPYHEHPNDLENMDQESDPEPQSDHLPDQEDQRIPEDVVKEMKPSEEFVETLLPEPPADYPESSGESSRPIAPVPLLPVNVPIIKSNSKTVESYSMDEL